MGISFADGMIPVKTVITGDTMEIKKTGKITVSKGHSVAINEDTIVSAEEMSYDKEKSLISANGNMKLFSKTQDLEPIEISGQYSTYNQDIQKGKVWGNVLLKYFINNSTSPLVLRAKEIYIDRNKQVLDALNDVVVITSSGTIYADNGSFDRKALIAVFKKDKKKPVVHMLNDGQDGKYEANKIIFYSPKNGGQRIVMKGSVVGKIKMEDKKDDTKN
jgi:lipopolysaccharide assembly outer membrane protein LptD (OstA)